MATARLKPEAVRVWGEQAYAQPDPAPRLGTIYDQFLGFVELPRIFEGGQLIINAPTALREALDQIIGKVGLIRHIAAFRPRKIDNTTASAKAAKRMILIGVLVMGLIAGFAHARFRSAILRALIPIVLFSPVLVIFGGSFLSADVSFVDKILATYRQFVSAQESSTSFLEMLKFLDPGRYVEYVSLQPHLTGWSLWFGNGYGFRYELNTDFLYEFGFAAVQEVSNAHFTPLAVTAKFGLFGLLIWFVTIGAVLTAKIDKSSYFQYACRLAFIAMVVQSIFAFNFFVNMYTPVYFAMATLGRSRVPKAARMLALQRGQSKGIS